MKIYDMAKKPNEWKKNKDLSKKKDRKGLKDWHTGVFLMEKGVNE